MKEIIPRSRSPIPFDEAGLHYWLNYLLLLSLFIFSALTGLFSWAFLEPELFL
jgi:hypothetical protein